MSAQKQTYFQSSAGIDDFIYKLLSTHIHVPPPQADYVKESQWASNNIRSKQFIWVICKITNLIINQKNTKKLIRTFVEFWECYATVKDTYYFYQMFCIRIVNDAGSNH